MMYNFFFNEGLHYNEMSLICIYSVAVSTFLLTEGVGNNLWS